MISPPTDKARVPAAAIDASIDAVAVLDSGGRYIYANPAYCRMHGFAGAAELLGCSWDHMHEAAERTRVRPDVMRELALSGFCRREAVGRRQDGTTFPEQLSVTLLDDGGMVCVLRDLTEEKAVQRERERLFREDKDEAIGRLAGGIAHDFNNLLAAIQGYGALLVEDLPEESAEKSFATQIVTATERAKALIDRLLAFSRAQNGPRRERIDVRELADRCGGQFRSGLSVAIDLRTSLPDTPAAIEGDPAQIEQALAHLLQNAAEAIGSSPGSIEIEVQRIEADALFAPADPARAGFGSVWFDEDVATRRTRLVTGPAQPAQSLMQILVRDNGRGMDRATMARMFEPFFSVKGVGEGSGLGLSAVQGIVATHDGVICVESQVGSGTSFALLLPAAPPMPEPAPDLRDEEGKVMPTKTRVLVVDDEPAIAELVARMLIRGGCDADWCCNPLDALETLRECPDGWQVVVSDQSMPEMEGDKFALQLKAINPAIGVVLCTGHEADRRPASPAISAVLQKPVSREQLKQAVDAALKDAAA